MLLIGNATDFRLPWQPNHRSNPNKTYRDQKILTHIEDICYHQCTIIVYRELNASCFLLILTMIFGEKGWLLGKIHFVDFLSNHEEMSRMVAYVNSVVTLDQNMAV